MTILEARLANSYRLLQIVLTSVFGGIGGLLFLMGLKLSAVMSAMGLFVIAAWLFFSWNEYRRGPRTLDDEGVTRRDGRRFRWAELKRIRRVEVPKAWAGPSPLNHIELHFPEGQVRIFPMTLENSPEILSFVEKIEERFTAPPPAAFQRPTVKDCRICSQLADYQSGCQKHAHEDEDTFLPEIAAELERVKEIRPGRTRSPVLERCPECGTFYLFKTTYEYLATGSEDGQILERLKAEDAARYLV